jgi:hypothetical protein
MEIALKGMNVVHVLWGFTVGAAVLAENGKTLQRIALSAFVQLPEDHTAPPIEGNWIAYFVQGLSFVEKLAEFA